MADATPPQPPSRLDRIEAGLDRLTERHEALAQSVEAFHHDLQEFRARGEADAKEYPQFGGYRP